LFQSHNGAIAARFFFTVNFNNHFVSIPQWCDCCTNQPRLLSLQRYSFNPTMVRLLRELVQGSAVIALMFQSHNGAIAAFHMSAGMIT